MVGSKEGADTGVISDSMQESTPDPVCLERFRATKILSEDTLQKRINILGLIDGQHAVLLLQRLHYDRDLFLSTNAPKLDLHAAPRSTEASSERLEHELSFEQQTVKVPGTLLPLRTISIIDINDIYYRFLATSAGSEDRPHDRVTLIYPATETHIRKYSQQRMHLYTETPQIYRSVVKPYIEENRGRRIQWVVNILEHRAEEESILYEDQDQGTGFVVIPNMNWDKKTMVQLYLLAIVRRRDIASLRDLNPSHISFLKTIREKIFETAKTLYGIEREDIRLFIHCTYQT